jgi:sodium-coupled neutral amino acid transporter 7/8/sodium-coupled neutral amino acid transporter 11
MTAFIFLGMLSTTGYFLAQPSSATCEDQQQPMVTRDDSSLSTMSPRSRATATPQSGYARAAASSRKAPLQRRATIESGEVVRQRWTIDTSCETMTSDVFVVSMFADLAPAGVLPVAHAVSGTGFIPTFLLLGFFCSLCVFTFYLTAKNCEISGQMDLAGQWETLVGPRSRWIPVAIVAIVCVANDIAYACFFSDIFTDVLPTLGIRAPRWVCCVMLSVFPTLPLCLKKDLSALAPSSTLAVLAVLYTVVVMVIRWLDGSYSTGGQFSNVTPTPSVPASHWLAFGMPALSLANSFAVAFLSHYNACKYYRELKAHTPARLATACGIAMGLCACVYGVSIVVGFQTFGTSADAVILRNYSPDDTLFTVARIAMGISLIASYPLMFSGLRESLIALGKIIQPDNTDFFDSLTFQDSISMFSVAFITICAILLTDTGLVVGLVGALCGSAIIYIVPAFLHIAALNSGLVDRSQNLGGILFAYVLVALGAFLGIAGTMTALKSS